MSRYENGRGLRAQEHRMLDERRAAGDVEAVELIERLARVRLAMDRVESVQWQAAYDELAAGFEVLLRERDRVDERVAEGIAQECGRLVEEMLRLREERDDANARANDEFGRRRALERLGAAA